MNTPLWSPKPDATQTTQLGRFAQMIATKYHLSGTDYQYIWDWSIKNIADYWSEIWNVCDIVGDRGDQVLDIKSGVYGAKFFSDSQVNYAENLLRKRGPETAIIFHGENGDRVCWSWDDLHDNVSRLQQFMRDHGICAGDRIAGVVHNGPYAIAAMLACASLGAVWSSCSPDFGLDGITDRFGQIEPKLLFLCDHYYYNGKRIQTADIQDELQQNIPSIGHLIICPYTHPSKIDSTNGWVQILAPYAPAPVTFDRQPFNAPLFILFSSGTTGLPKCIVHSIGGLLLKHLSELRLHCDLNDNDRFFYFTTCGWMMWNWQVSGLAVGCRLILYDGSPFYPDGNRLPQIVADERITHFGTSAKYIDACQKAEIAPKSKYDLSALRTIFSTGSPLAPASFDYVYQDWSDQIMLSSIAGGTDICGCFIGGSPISPVYRGQCQQRLLGLDVQVFDDLGHPITDGPGELVCCTPHPSQPIGFWNDPDDKRYRAAYFDRFEGVWHHGDYVELTPQGGAIFHGRSDAVLNPGGVRIGTAEIYRQVEHISDVQEALVIGQNWDNDVRVVLFVRLRDGVKLNDKLITQIKTTIRTNATPRHVPAKIIAVADIPRTKSGKITELAVRDVIHGRPVKNTGSLANPEALNLFRDLPELEK